MELSGSRTIPWETSWLLRGDLQSHRVMPPDPKKTLLGSKSRSTRALRWLPQAALSRVRTAQPLMAPQGAGGIVGGPCGAGRVSRCWSPALGDGCGAPPAAARGGFRFAEGRPRVSVLPFARRVAAGGVGAWGCRGGQGGGKVPCSGQDAGGGGKRREGGAVVWGVLDFLRSGCGVCRGRGEAGCPEPAPCMACAPCAVRHLRPAWALHPWAPN